MAEPSGDGPAPADLGLRYGPLTLRVESNDTAHLDWLREFLTLSFEAVEPPPLARTVRLRPDAAEYATALSRGPRPGIADGPGPAFECSLAPRTYGDPAFARRLLDALGL